MIFLTKPSQIVLFTITIAALAVSISAKPILETLQADLLPITNNFKDNGVVFVVNQGALKSEATWLTLQCYGDCPHYPNTESYSHPLFPDSIAIRIPPLKAGQVFKHKLAFWKAVSIHSGQAEMQFLVDRDNKVDESNEENNQKSVILSNKKR